MKQEKGAHKILFLFVILLLSFSAFDYASSQENRVIVHQEIYDVLRLQPDVSVFVKLRDGNSDFDLYQTPQGKIEFLRKEIRSNQEAVLASLPKEAFTLTHQFTVTNAFGGRVTSDGLKIIKENPLVEGIYFDRSLELFLPESVPLIGADNVWQQPAPAGGNLRGQGQNICVVDTGVNYSHPNLGGCFGPGCKVRDGYDFVDNDPDPMDVVGHGTHVAGIAAANGTLQGVAPEANIFAVRVCSGSGCSLNAIASGIDWCNNQQATYGNIVTSVSIGTASSYTNSSCPTTWGLEAPINTANALGIPVVVASGNSNSKTGIAYPACLPNAISVGAVYDANVGPQTYGASSNNCSDLTTQADLITCFSNTAPNLDLVAPGAIITSPFLTGVVMNQFCGDFDSNGLAECYGTSMAAPHISGVIALLKQKVSNLSVAQIVNALTTTGVQVTDPANGLNFPRVNALAAVNSVGVSPGNQPPVITSQPPQTAVIGMPFSYQIVATDPENDPLVYSIVSGLGVSINSSTGLLQGTFTQEGTTPAIHVRVSDPYHNTDDIFSIDVIRMWSPDVRLTAIPSISFLEPTLALDLQGNVHIVYDQSFGGGGPYDLYYLKRDNSGQVLVSPTRITFTQNGRDSAIAVDTSGNVHVVWEDVGTTGWDIYYKKLDNVGNILVNDTRITFVNSSSSLLPSNATDSQGNVHVVWQDQSAGNSEIYYLKLNGIGNILVNTVRITNHPAASVRPKLAVDTQGNVHIAWQDNRNWWQIFYEKLNGSGNTLINDLYVGGGILTWPAYSPDVAVSPLGPAYIVWEEGFMGSEDIYYRKLLSNGTFASSPVRVTNNPASSWGASVAVSPQNGNIHVYWLDGRDWSNGLRDFYYEIFTDGGGVVANDKRLTFAGQVGDYDRAAIVDASGKAHLVWSDWRDTGGGWTVVYYKQSLPSASVSIQGTPQVGGTMTLQLSDPFSAGAPYVVGFALGSRPGITTPSIPFIPLNADWLFDAVIGNPATFGNGLTGTLNANGQAVATVAIPNNPSLQGVAIYAAFATLNGAGMQNLSISPPLQLMIQ